MEEFILEKREIVSHFTKENSPLDSYGQHRWSLNHFSRALKTANYSSRHALSVDHMALIHCISQSLNMQTLLVCMSD